jgi:hypothetical protein
LEVELGANVETGRVLPEAHMNRRSFLQTVAVGTLLLTVPINEAHPVQVYGEVLTSEDLASFPTGSTFDSCHIKLTKPMPLGFRYVGCTVTTVQGFQGAAIMVCPAEKQDPHTYVVNCILDGKHAPAAIAYVA